MRQVFVDASAWIALYNHDDQFHAAAKPAWRAFANQSVRLLTSDYILDESYTLVRRRANLKAAVALHDLLVRSKVVRVLEVDASLRADAWALFVKYEDKLLSYTDCTSFALMQKYRLYEVFAFDADFARLGFVVVPTSRSDH